MLEPPRYGGEDMKHLFSWLGDNLSYIIKKWADYTFRRRSIWAWGIRYFSLSLVYELTMLATDSRLTGVWDLLDQKIGQGWSLLLELLASLVFGNFNLGYSVVNIVLKLSLVIFFSLLQTRRESSQPFIYVARRSWKPSKKWFTKVFKKHFTAELREKYHHEIFEDQGVGKHIYKLLTQVSPYKDKALQTFETLDKKLDEFQEEYRSMIEHLEIEGIAINQESSPSIHVNGLLSNFEDIKVKLKKYIKILKKDGTEIFDLLSPILPDFLKEPRIFDPLYVEQYPLKDQFISQTPRKPNLVSNVFYKLESIANIDSEWTNLLLQIQSKEIFIYGNAGIGKSNLSAYLASNLFDDGYPVVIVKGSSFRGSPDSFDEILKRELEIPDDLSVLDALEKLNRYGKRKQKRVTIIFDALNETTYETIGFSPIWRNSLDDFLSQLSGFSYIFFIATLRRSYIKRIWDDYIPYESHELSGFTSDNIKSVVKKYFEHYQITHGELNTREIIYFRNPLLLDLYCKMVNPKRAPYVQAPLGIRGFQEVFDTYLTRLKIKTKKDLGLISEQQVSEGFGRCSDAMIENIEAMIPVQQFYYLMDGKEVEKEDGTIAQYVLNGYLIYRQESILKRDVIIHSQQQVGGYLLARRLLEKHNNIQGVMESDFFRDFIIIENGGHQLKDDILQFLTIDSINYLPYIDLYLDNDRVKRFMLFKLQNEAKAEWNSALRTKLIESFSENKDYQILLDYSKSVLTVSDSPLRIGRLSNYLLQLEGLNFEMVWTQFVYQNANILWQEMEKFLEQIDKYQQDVDLDESKELQFELAILLLESTVRDLRDLATKALIEFGSFFPHEVFEKLYEYSDSTKIYIYERLASISYGICLRKQNDPEFVRQVLGPNALRIYDLQFAGEPMHATYNYIVIDSFKHLIDLAIHKGVYKLDGEQKTRLNQYQFTFSAEWVQATHEDREIVRDISVDSYMADGPDPLRMDFVIYTISRLIPQEIEERFEVKLTAVANIYRRIFELGYQTLEFEDRDSPESKFFYGVNVQGLKGKVDRLGKKYSWLAFFDYAGYLLNQGALDVWYSEGAGAEGEYQRLNDVRIEASNTSASISEERRLYTYPMLGEKKNNKEWASQTLYHTIFHLWNQTFEKEEFTLIHGKVEEKLNESYDTRTFLIIEAFLVKKEDIEGKVQLIIDREFDWNDDIAFHATQSKTYFGELYWADNVSSIDPSDEWLPLEETEEIEIPLSFQDTLMYDEYKEEKSGDIVKRVQPKQLLIRAEPATIDYFWESESEVFPTLNRHIPSPNIGRHLDLQAEPERFTFLNPQSQVATHYFEYDDGLVDQDFTYLRSDLLNRYLKDKGLILMYQIKQHSYDNVRDSKIGSNFRGMQFFFPHIMNKEK